MNENDSNVQDLILEIEDALEKINNKINRLQGKINVIEAKESDLVYIKEIKGDLELNPTIKLITEFSKMVFNFSEDSDLKEFVSDFVDTKIEKLESEIDGVEDE